MYNYKLETSGWEEHDSEELLHAELKTPEQIEQDVCDVLVDAVKNGMEDGRFYSDRFDHNLLRYVVGLLVKDKGYQKLEFAATWETCSNDGIIPNREDDEYAGPQTRKFREILHAAGIDEEYQEAAHQRVRKRWKEEQRQVGHSGEDG